MQSSRPRRILPAIVVAQFAGTSLWFAGNGVLPDLQRDLGLGADALATITSAVQLGFIAGTLVFAVTNLADRFSPRGVFLACALLGAATNAAILPLAGGEGAYAALLALRFATGFCLAGIYPVGMKIAASWYREGLGGALGYLLGALVLGTALPHLIRGLGHSLPWTTVLAWLSALAAAGGVLMYVLVPDGPHHERAARFDPRALVSIFAVRELRASAFGYFGHMWELYTFWAFLPVLIGAYAARDATLTLNISVLTFWVVAVGAIGCAAGGIFSRRAGSAKVAFAQLSVSGVCCLLSPLAFALPLAGFIAFLTLWGICVVGDSPQFSALTAATAPKALVGSALTLVNSIGFALTIVSIQVTSALASWIPVEYWFVPVALGPALGLLAVRPLAASPHGRT